MRNGWMCALGLLTMVSLWASCSRERHFIREKDAREQVTRDLQVMRSALAEGGAFEALDSLEMSELEREEMDFLFAYMPLADITDYPVDFHLQNVRAANRARSEMRWGDSIPDMVFRHFVLPVRVNNEHLDSARVVFYEELKPRVQELSMEDAILEVNHWCHEKVVYQPTDGRTSSPLNTVRTAYGRCGEESTLLVAALRSVGIPARQVYTPRWAHTDDNHAWVEAWASGKWYFLGACEPEPVLNLGWFNAPASRGMLMTTRVFGRYSGDEEVLERTPNYTVINVTSHYAPVSDLAVKVVDGEGNAMEGTRVEFKLYNYAEFYTVAQKYSDAQGLCHMTAGRGDMLVWASRDGAYGFTQVSFGKDSEVTVRLTHTAGEPLEWEGRIVPPKENAVLPVVSPEQRAENDRRMAQEDSIRHVYVSTFFDTTEAAEFMAKHTSGDAALDARFAQYLVDSRGNHPAISSFISRSIARKMSAKADKLLGILLPKDLRDIDPEILWDSMERTREDDGDSFCYVEGLLNPRIYLEQLTPYKGELQNMFRDTPLSSPEEVAEWCRKNVTLIDSLNSSRIQMSPISVARHRVTDRRSRDEFFVALSRALGYPAWMDQITGKIQYELPSNAAESSASGTRISASISGKAFTSDRIGTVVWDEDKVEPAPSGKLRADYSPTKLLPDPQYYSHFTLSRIVDGRPVLQEYSEGTGWSDLLRDGTLLEAGDYMLVTGTRLANGTVLSRMTIFQVKAGEEQQVPLVMSSDEEEVQVIGSFNSESKFLPIGSDTPTSILNAAGRGYFVIGLLGAGEEPTNHALRDIIARKSEFDEWGRKMIFLFPDQAAYEKYSRDNFGELPQGVIMGIDTEGIAAQIRESMHLNSTGGLPIFIIGDTFNRVVYLSTGYSIGLGDTLLRTIHKL